MRKIPLFKPFIPPREELMPALEETLYSGYIAQGEKVVEFEKKFGEYIGNPNVVAVSSCTAALHLALLLAGVGPGDEVISTPMTAEPTNMAILYTGAKIVWADVYSGNGNIDPDSIRDKVTDKTKAIIAVHYGGIPVDIHNLQDAAHWYGLVLIEDCAHALGAKYDCIHVGNTSHYGCFSFQAIKHMTTIEGGVLVINDDRAKDMIEDARKLRWFGIDRDAQRTTVDIVEAGYKYNFNDVSATMGLVQLRHILYITGLHKSNGRWFDSNLNNSTKGCICPSNVFPSFWFYTLLISPSKRDNMMQHLQENGIGCGTVHRRNDEHSVFIENTGNLLGAQSGLARFCASALHIPCGWWVTPDDRKYIAEKIEEALK